MEKYFVEELKNKILEFENVEINSFEELILKLELELYYLKTHNKNYNKEQYYKIEQLYTIVKLVYNQFALGRECFKNITYK